jgi:hypothetical protein
LKNLTIKAAAVAAAVAAMAPGHKVARTVKSRVE